MQHTQFALHWLVQVQLFVCPLQVRSLLRGEASRPKHAGAEEELATMSEVVEGLQQGTLDSEFVHPRLAEEPFTPPAQMMPSNNT